MPETRPPSDALSELDARARVRVRVVGLAAGLAAALLVAVAGASLRQPLFDAFQNVLPAPDVSRRVHVVVLDADSLREVGGWPWSRFYLARLVEEIAGRGASAVGLDMLLPEADRFDPLQFKGLYTELPPDMADQVGRLPSMDALFARVIGRNPVVLARAGVRPGSFDFLDHAAAPLPPEARFVGQPPRDMLQFQTVVANLPIIDAAPLGHGLVNGDRDPDGVVRRVPLVARAAGELTPGFALELVRVAEGAPQIVLERRGGRLQAVRVGRRRVAASADGQLLLRFGDWRKIQTTSAVNLLRRGMPGDLFKDQIVLVGITSAGASDVAGTPRARAISGVFVQAQAVDAILRGAGLREPDWGPPLEWGLGLLMALGAWISVPRLPMAAVAGIAGTEVVAALGGSALAFQLGLLVDPFPVLVPGAAASAAMVLALFLEGRRLQAGLRADLEAERRRADERQRLLINELNHRVKNTLATVQSMAVQTLRPGRSPAEAREAFNDRLMALSAAHNLLTAEGWEGADLGDIVRTATAPFDDPPGERFTICGPSVRMIAPSALGLALALQELGSNALKFGALSAPGGHVEVVWTASADGEVRLVWTERGGPTVSPPTHRGFGARLLERGLAHELNGHVALAHPPDGLRCEIVFRLEPAASSARDPTMARPSQQPSPRPGE